MLIKCDVLILLLIMISPYIVNVAMKHDRNVHVTDKFDRYSFSKTSVSVMPDPSNLVDTKSFRSSL